MDRIDEDEDEALLGPRLPLWRACVSRTAWGKVLSDELHVLLIDPSDDDRALATTLLGSRTGTARVEAIATAAALMASLARGGFDVVVAEYRTPWIEGPALLDAITQSCPGVPVIFLTSTDDTERAVAMMRAGAADYLVKSSRGFLRLSTAVDEAVLAAGTDAPSWPPDVSEDPPASGGDPARQERINTELRGLVAQMRAGAADYLAKSSRGFLRLSTAVDEAVLAAGTDAPSRPPDVSEDPPASGGDPARQERINTELRGLIAQAVHELDAPLRMVAQQTKMVEDHARGLDGEGRRSLGLALEGVSRMQELLDDLAAYSRIEAEPIRVESCECNALVDRVARQLEIRFGVANVRIQRATLPAVQAEPSQLMQVFENLISNGLKFQTEKPARVEIWARAVGEEWLFSVRDYGLGVEPEFADSIFDLFKRLRPEYPGAGVGLAICRRIVERHGGRIWVESKAGGGGHVHLHPVEEPEKRREHAAIRGGFQPEATRAVTRVLLVEDNPEDVRTVERLLTAADTPFDLTSVGRVSDALARLTTGDVDVVLLDLGLPDSDPSQTFDRVSAEARRIPIIILTGQNDKRMAALAVRSGAQDFLVKRHLDGPLLDRSLQYAVERQRYHDALRDSEERYALAVEGSNDGLWDWDLRTNEVYYSPRWMSMLGLVETEVPGRPETWLSRVHADDAAELRRDIDEHLAGGTDHFSNAHRIRGTDGSYRWMLSRGVVRRDQRGATRMAGSLTDIHQQKLVEERLRRDALSDALTGLSNWTLFKDRLRAAIAKAKRQPAHQLAVLFLDLDRFKTINDSLGHSNGDKLLVAVAKRVVDVLRPGDTLARLGGDEFAVLVEECSEPSDARRVADRIHAAFKAPLYLDGHEVFVSTSIGTALSSARYEFPEECLRDADTAMYRAKAAGRGGHAIFGREMHQRAVEQLQLENDLRRAVARREFRVHYQPIVWLDSGSLQGFEALVRWEHPERGLLMPDAFIPMAEDSGLIVPMGWLVFEEACRQVVAWQNGRGETPFVSVNFSSRQIRQPDLVPRVEEVLRRTGCKATDLRVELTETMIMESAESGFDKLASLSNLDLQLYIDDFGTGYSSLSYLQRLPTNAIKIDRSFVNEVAEKPQIVGTIVALAKSLNMRVEAEGIETEDQLARLRELGCESGQGYYFSKALTPTAATSLVETRPIH